jgi:hypothetical protein
VTGIEPALSAWEALACASGLTREGADRGHEVSTVPWLTAVAPGVLADLARRWHGVLCLAGIRWDLTRPPPVLRWPSVWDSVAALVRVGSRGATVVATTGCTADAAVHQRATVSTPVSPCVSSLWSGTALRGSRVPARPRRRTGRRRNVSESGPGGDPVPPGLVLDLDEAFRVLEALEDARLSLREIGAAPGL